MEDHLTQNGTQPHPKWKTISPKRKDDLIQNGRRPQLKQNTTKNENDPEGRLPESKTTKRKMTNKEDDQKGNKKKKTTKNYIVTIYMGKGQRNGVTPASTDFFHSIEYYC